MIAWAHYPYQGRVVLVTGAGTGIGRATARAFLEQGAGVAVLGRRPEPLREAVAGFDAERVQVLGADVTEDGALEVRWPRSPNASTASTSSSPTPVPASPVPSTPSATPPGNA